MVAPAAALHSCSSMIQLGTRAHDIIELDRKANNICDKVKAKGLKEFERLDIEKNLQPFDILEVTTSLIDTKIEMLWELKDHDNTMKLCWCSGTVIALKRNDKVIIEWMMKHLIHKKIYFLLGLTNQLKKVGDCVLINK